MPLDIQQKIHSAFRALLCVIPDLTFLLRADNMSAMVVILKPYAVQLAKLQLDSPAIAEAPPTAVPSLTAGPSTAGDLAPLCEAA